MTKFKIPGSYYIPEGKYRLLSPQHWAMAQPKHLRGQERWHSSTHADKCVLHYGRSKLTVPISKVDNVATFYSAPGFKGISKYRKEALISNQMKTDGGEDELRCEVAVATSSKRRFWSLKSGLPMSKRQAMIEEKSSRKLKDNRIDFGGLESSDAYHHETQEEMKHASLSQELLNYHKRFGHIHFKRLYEMAKQGVIPRRLMHAEQPACAACLYARATKKGWRGKGRLNWQRTTRATSPGQCISVDQLNSPTPGLVAQMKGRLTKSRYTAATVYVDQYSGFGYIYLQKGTNAEETLEGKRAFELMCKQNGVQVRNYHADNGIFRGTEWMKDCEKLGQGLTFAGVNAHHTNGLAERRIRSLQDLTRSMLVDAHRKWRTTATASLWPYAMVMANDTLNQTPNLRDESKRSPQQTFSNTEVQINPKHWAPFGCPAYVLARELQNPKGIYNKWKKRSEVGIYLGRSPNYGRNVALVLNRETGHVSPQFHVSLDGTFKSIDGSLGQQWINKAGLDAKQSERGKVRPQKQKQKRQAKVGPLREGALKKRRLADRIELSESNSVEAALEANADASTNQEVEDQNDKLPSNEAIQTNQTEMMPSSMGSQAGADPTQPANLDVEADAQVAESTLLTEDSQLDGENVELFSFQAMFDECMTTYDNDDPLLVYKATSDPDTMYHHEAMKERDAKNFRDAMTKEWEDQFNNGNFTIMLRSQLPMGATVLPAVWQMKRKRDIRTGEIKKYKARLNLDGSRMVKGKHYELTYSPVVRWFSVRLLLALALANSWHTTQIDYVLAYPQAPIEREIYMEIPRGMRVKGGKREDYVLKLHRNIYGQKQAGRVWYKYLSSKLTNEVGFQKSKVDEGVFYRGWVMYVLYTDDSILAAPTKKEVDDAISDIQKAGLNITVEGDVNDFLGVNINKKKDGEMEMTQPHLIKQIRDDMGFDFKTKSKNLPACSSKILKRHQESEEFDKSFNYRSIVGKLNYLEKATRPDISYATHQCARFVENPKVEHAKAIRQIARYLVGTKDKGTSFKIDKTKGLEVFVDSDFAGSWDKNDSLNSDTARSRHGYFITYNGVPLLWKSQLQHEIALSTTEAEYTALSYSLREAIPIINLLQEMKNLKFNVSDEIAKIHCKVFEDNSGAIEIAKEDKYRPRTKHLNCRLHHFRTYVESGAISIHKIDTYHQPADLLTKPLNQEDFCRHRLTMMGW